MRLAKRETRELFVPNDEDNASVKIKYLYKSERRRIEDRVNSVAYERQGDSEGTTRVDFSPYSRSFMIAEECITNWDGWFDVVGNAIPFNKQSIRDLAKFTITEDGETLDFLAWVEKHFDKLCSEVDREQEKADLN